MRGQELTKPRKLKIMCTSYCGCGHCCGWEWGLTLPGRQYLALGDVGAPRGTKQPFDLHQPLNVTLQRLQSFDLAALRPKNVRLKPRKTRQDLRPGLFCRYWTTTDQKGLPYTGVTSTGVFPKQARAPLLSTSQLAHRPLRIPLRLLQPWKALPTVGTIAADTRFFSFGTKMLVPGYGWGLVQDHGSAIQGRLHVDLFHRSHREALEWGRKELEVFVVPPGKHAVDAHPVPEPVKPLARLAHDAFTLFFGVHH